MATMVAALFLWSSIFTLPSLADKYDNYMSLASKIDAGVYTDLKDLNLTDSLIVVPDMYWGSGFMLNDLDLDGDILFVRDAHFNKSTEEVYAAYPGRSFIRYQRENGGYALFPLN